MSIFGHLFRGRGGEPFEEVNVDLCSRWMTSEHGMRNCNDIHMVRLLNIPLSVYSKSDDKEGSISHLSNQSILRQCTQCHSSSG